MAIKELGSVTVSLVLLAISCTIFVVNRVLSATRDVREPPFIPSIIPYFGHMIGLFWHRHGYYAKLMYISLTEMSI